MATEPVASLRTQEYDLLRTLVREVREAKKLSQEELSRKMGRPITYIGKVELGTRRLDIIELMQICATLDHDVLQVVADLKTRVEKLDTERQTATDSATVAEAQV